MKQYQVVNIITQPEYVTQKLVIQKLRDNLDYGYLGQLDDTYYTPILEDSLREYLLGRGESDQNIDRAIRELRNAINSCTGYGNLTDASEKVYDMLRYGIQISQQRGTTHTVELIDWKNPTNNLFEVADEVMVKAEGTEHDHRRPDIVVYVNGIALAVIELKKASVSVAEGIRQNWRNQQDGNIPRFFTTVQLAMAGNESEGLYYGTTSTSEKYYLKWKEPVGTLAGGEKMPVSFADEQSLLYRSILQLLEPNRLLEMIHDLIVYDGGVKKICRPNQYFALKAAQPRIKAKDSGIIWHSQGSGKSLTMVWLAQWIRENVDNARVVIITDRDELDKQITKALRNSRLLAHNKGDKHYHATSGNDLLNKLNSADPWLITTLIHKFATRNGENGYQGKKSPEQWMQEISENLERNFPGFQAKGNIFVFVDECHRTQGGIMHKAMKKIMGENVMMIGFTGTPLLSKKEKAILRDSQRTFGRYIHCYRYDEAVQDKVVLDLKYEARDIEQNVHDAKAIDQLFDKSTKRLTSMAKQEIQRRWATMQKLYSSKERMERIVADILKDMEIMPALSGGYGNAMLVCDSIYQAYQYWHILQETELADHCAVISSYEPTDPTLSQGFTGAKKTEEELKYKWAKQMLGNKRPEAFEEWAKDQFINHPERMKLLIVVDKLLTGFDAPTATYLYLDRKIVDHNLFQAICRVNRVNGEMKLFGYIIDYMQLFKFIHSAISDYTSTAAEPDGMANYDEEEIKLLVKSRIDDLKKELEEALEAVDIMCEDIDEPRGIEQFFSYFCYPSTIVDDEEQTTLLEKNLFKRQLFYNAVSKLARVYGEAANELDEMFSRERAEYISQRVKDYIETRTSLMLRSGDSVDMKIYDAEMRSLIDRYIGAEGSVTNDELKDFTFLDLIQTAIEDEENGNGSKERGQRETMINNTRKFISRRRNANPQEYQRLSSRLQRLVADLKQGHIDYHEFLVKIKEINEALIHGGIANDPWIDCTAKKDLYDNLGEDIDLTKSIFDVISQNASQGFRNHPAFKARLKAKVKQALAATDIPVDVIMGIIENHPEQWI